MISEKFRDLKIEYRDSTEHKEISMHTANSSSVLSTTSNTVGMAPKHRARRNLS